MAVAANRKTVLVVEDDRGLNDLLVHLFGVTGYRVLRAYEGSEVPDLIERKHPDVVILDLMLPGMTGEEILRQVKGDPATSGTPFVIVTGFADRLTEQDCELADAVFTKPFDVDRLLAEVERLA